MNYQQVLSNNSLDFLTDLCYNLHVSESNLIHQKYKWSQNFEFTILQP